MIIEIFPIDKEMNDVISSLDSKRGNNGSYEIKIDSINDFLPLWKTIFSINPQLDQLDNKHEELRECYYDTVFDCFITKLI